MAHAFALEPESATMALDHVTHGQARGFMAHLHRVHFPAHHRLGTHRLAGPYEVQLGFARAARRRRQAQLHETHLELVGQAAGQVHQRLQHRKALHLEPQSAVHVHRRSRQAGHHLNATQRRVHEIGAQHVFQRPAGLEAVGRARFQRPDALAERARFFADDPQEAFAHGGFQIGVVEHVDRGLHVGQCRTAALGERVQHLVFGRLGLVVARDVVQHQHEAAQLDAVGGGLGRLGLHRAHRRHLHPQQLARRRGGDELGRGLARAAQHALLDVLQRVGHQLAVEHAVDGAAQADQLGPAGHPGRLRERAELHASAVVVQQDAPIEVTDHHALRQLGHERGQPRALLLDALGRLAHPRIHLAAQLFALDHELVEQVGQHLGLDVALGVQVAHDVGAQKHLSLFGQLHRGCDPVVEPAHQTPGDGGHANAPGQADQRQAAFQQAPHHVAVLRVQGGAHQPEGCQQPGDGHHGRNAQQPPQPPVGLAMTTHAAAPSISLTFCTSSLVENGLVM
ncbi:hypothetical protein FQZ97_715070 [compost metagenome]